MNAVESAPSAKRSRNKFGNRNAMRNASRFLPAPNRPANTVSRTRPSTRLHRIATPTTPVARMLMRRSAASAIAGHFVGRFSETPILNSAANLTTNGIGIAGECCSVRCPQRTSFGGCQVALGDLSKDQSSSLQDAYAPQSIRVVPRDPRFQLTTIFRARDRERGQILRCQE